MTEARPTSPTSTPGPEPADSAPDLGALWLYFMRARREGGQPVVEYLQLSQVEGTVPPGVGLYPTRNAAKQAAKYRTAHPSRQVPAGLQSVAVTVTPWGRVVRSGEEGGGEGTPGRAAPWRGA